MSYTCYPDLADEVAIPEDGILSRVLHKDDHIRLVVFAFDEGQELTEHTAAVPAVVQVIRGRIGVDVGGDRVEMVAGAWLRMDARLPHSLVATEPSVVLLTLFTAASAS